MSIYLRDGVSGLPLGHSQIIIDPSTLDLGFSENGVPILGALTLSGRIDTLENDTVGVGVRKLICTWDGNLEDLAAGHMGYISPLDLAGNLVKVSLWAPGAPADVSIDIWKAAKSTLPLSVADSIVGADPPALAAQEFIEKTSFTGWSTLAVGSNDAWALKISSVSVGVKFLQATLFIQV